MRSPPRTGLCTAAAAVVVTVAVAGVAAVAAAAPAARPGLDGGAAATATATEQWAAAEVAAVLSAAAAPMDRGAGVVAAAGRPLTPGVSVLTDGAYTLAHVTQTPAGCPPSLTISGPLATGIGIFVVPPPSLSVDGVGCTGASVGSALLGLTGTTLVDVARQVEADITSLLQVHPQAAIAFVYEGPLTCGAVELVSERVWTLLVSAGVPVLLVSGVDDPAAGCRLTDRTALPLAAATAVTAGLSESSLTAAGVVRARVGGGGAAEATRVGA